MDKKNSWLVEYGMILLTHAWTNSAISVVFLGEWSISGLWLKFELTDGLGMMHKAWSSIE